MDANATNYNSEATIDDGTCEFSDSDGDGVFDHLEIEGCTNSNATNLMPMPPMMMEHASS